MTADGPEVRPTSARGFALIIVLLFLVLIAAIGTDLLANARMETAIARNIRSTARAEALAQAGVAEAVFNQIDPAVSGRWKPDGSPHRFRSAEGEFLVRITDENSKVNPNLSSDALLAALFESAGLEQMQARRLGAAIADWVGPQPTPRPLGAKLEQYQAAGKSYGPPNAPIQSLDELQLVLGMTPQIFAAVRPYLTIYSDGQTDPEYASPVVRRALSLVPASDSDADAGAATDQNAPNAAPSDQPATPASAPQPSTDAPANAPESVLDIDVVARLADGGTFVRDVVVKLDPGSTKGYAVLDWRRGTVDQ